MTKDNTEPRELFNDTDAPDIFKCSDEELLAMFEYVHEATRDLAESEPHRQDKPELIVFETTHRVAKQVLGDGREE